MKPRGVLTVGAVLIIASAFMQAADARQFREPGPMTQGGYARSGSAWN
jgi:hypothetical protein